MGRMVNCKACGTEIRQNELGNWFHVNAMEWVHSTALPPRTPGHSQRIERGIVYNVPYNQCDLGIHSWDSKGVCYDCGTGTRTPIDPDSMTPTGPLGPEYWRTLQDNAPHNNEPYRGRITKDGHGEWTYTPTGPLIGIGGGSHGSPRLDSDSGSTHSHSDHADKALTLDYLPHIHSGVCGIGLHSICTSMTRTWDGMRVKCACPCHTTHKNTVERNKEL